MEDLRSRSRSRAVALALAFGGGLLATASVPPFGWWPLGIAGLSLLAVALGGAGLRRRIAVGLSFGIGLYGPSLAWMGEFHPAWVAVPPLEAALTAAGLALAPPAGRLRALGVAGALVLGDLLRSLWPFGGLPLSGLDLGQAAGPFASAVRLGGRLTLVLAIALVGAGLAEAALAARGRRRRDTAAGLTVAAAGVAIAALGWVVPHGRDIGPLDVAVVQGGGRRGFRAIESSAQDVFAAHLAASRAVGPGRDLVLWPENVVDVDGGRFESSGIARTVAEEADRLDATLVVGVTDEDPGPGVGDDPSGAQPAGFRNAAVAFGPEGERIGRYEKVRRVPFGEFIPFRSFVGRFADLSVVPSDAVPGTGTGLLRSPAAPLGVAISYEVFFGDRTAAAARAGGEVVLIPTNAASFATSQMPAQQVAASRLRALETGRWLLQAGPTGFSAVVAPDGDVVERTDLGERQVLEASIARRTGETPYLVLGPLPAVAAAGAALAAAWWRELRRVRPAGGIRPGARSGAPGRRRRRR